MRTAIISDLHGSLRGLDSVLADSTAMRCDRVICLGDLIDGGPDEAAVVRAIRDRGIPTVRGNHDVGSRARLGATLAGWLEALPERLVEGDVVFTHISPRAKQTKIRDRHEAWNVFDETPFRLSFIGHVHVPMVYASDGDDAVSARELRFTAGRPIAIDPALRYVVCVGAVACGRDGIDKPRYAIHERGADGAESIEIRSTDGPVIDLERGGYA